MELTTILFIIACVLVGFIAWKLFKSVIKTAFSIIGITLLCVIIMGTAIAIDANDFRKTLKDEPTIYILQGEGEIYASFKAQGLLLTQKESVPKEKSIQLLNQSRKELRDLEHKIFVFDINGLEWDMLKEDPQEYFKKINYESANNLFHIALLETILDDGPGFVYTALRQDKAYVLPKTPLVRFINFAPKKIIENIQDKTSQTTQNVKETINQQLEQLNLRSTVDENEEEDEEHNQEIVDDNQVYEE